jgi:hypothetical protein
MCHGDGAAAQEIERTLMPSTLLNKVNGGKGGRMLEPGAKGFRRAGVVCTLEVA